MEHDILLHALVAACTLSIVVLLRSTHLVTWAKDLVSVQKRSFAILASSTSDLRKERAMQSAARKSFMLSIRCAAVILAIALIVAAFELVGKYLELSSLIEYLVSIQGIAESLIYGFLFFYLLQSLAKSTQPK